MRLKRRRKKQTKFWLKWIISVHRSNQYTRQVVLGGGVEVVGRRRHVINDPSGADDDGLHGPLLLLIVSASAVVDNVIDSAGRTRRQIERHFGGAAALYQVRDDHFRP